MVLRAQTHKENGIQTTRLSTRIPAHVVKSAITRSTRHPINTSRSKLTRLAGEDETTIVSTDYAGARNTEPIFVAYSSHGMIHRNYPEISSKALEKHHWRP